MKKRNRYYGLTIPYRLCGCDVVNYVKKMLDEKNVINYTFAISNLEIGDETEYEHYHAMIRFENAVQVEYVKNIFGDIHNEIIVSISGYMNYISKTGLLYCDINIKEKEDLSRCILDDIKDGFTLKQLIFKYPTFSLYHFNQLKDMYNFLNFTKDEDR